MAVFSFLYVFFIHLIKGTVQRKSSWDYHFKLPSTVFKMLKSPVYKRWCYRQGDSRCKTCFSDLEDSAETRRQNGQCGYVFHCSQLLLLSMHALGSVSGPGPSKVAYRCCRSADYVPRLLAPYRYYIVELRLRAMWRSVESRLRVKIPMFLLL
jgi:hypothetical protein